MRSYFLFAFLAMHLLYGLFAQEKRDTLYFNYDADYIINGDTFSNLEYGNFEQAVKHKIHKTGTNGYFYFLPGCIIGNIQADSILSLKEYAESKNFYLDGKYNKIIDIWKLEEKLLKPYEIILVQDGQYIKPEHLQYDSYYPMGKGHKSIDLRIKDSLIFKWDELYFKVNETNPNNLYLIDSGRDGSFYFELGENMDSIKFAKNEITPKNYIRQSRHYTIKNQKLNDYDLYMHLNNYIVFLVKANEVYRIIPSYELK